MEINPTVFKYENLRKKKEKEKEDIQGWCLFLYE